jgi:hypothetical protein
LGCITVALACALAGLACAGAGLALSGCGGMRGGAPRRIVEREEAVGKARVRLKSELSPARGTLGDPISWRLTATLGGGGRAGTPSLEEPSSSLELDVSRAPAGAKAEAGLSWSREYVLRGFDIGAIPLPRAMLPVTMEGRTDTLEFPRDTLFVDSLTPAATGMLRPDRGPITPPLRPADIALLAGGVLLLAALIFFLVRLWLRRRRRKQVAEAPAPPEPPEVLLARALDALERDVATLPRDVFYERLANALRAYAAAATGVPAIDLTTTELDRELGRRPVPADGREALVAALRRADLAKFARYRDEESEARSILRQARSVSGRL